MYKRRESHRPSIDLIESFKKSFPILVLTGDGAFSLATPVATSIEEGRSLDELSLMSFDPNLFGQLEEDSEQATTPGGRNLPSTSQAGSASYYADFPSPWHQSPGISGYYGHQQQQQYQWAPMSQHRFLTPSSRSLSLPSSTNTQQQPAFLSLQDIQLQPSYNQNQYDVSTYQPFSPQMSGLMTYGTQQGSSAQLGPSSSQHQPILSTTGRAALPSSEFRFQISLINGTAMVKDNDIPVSYLNKRQTYKVVIRDTRPERASSIPTTYRTFIRVSFHEEKQRSRPDQYWQLWKEGRGMNEAQQHGGKLQAIEYVPQSQAPGQHTSVHLEKESFDGFCVNWSTPNGLTPQCEVQFRCNFLSTDFSRSKGVKGIPVRLCAKSEVVGSPSAMGPPLSGPEVCYCKIKLFRDHGAERKLTNDEAAIKRLVAKTEEQIKQSQAESGEDNSMNSNGKRRGSDFSPTDTRPSKMLQQKRASSISSEGSSQVQEGEGDLSNKLGNLTRLLRSRQEITMFFLRGDESDDPDLHPVFLREKSDDTTPKASPELKREERRDAPASELPSAVSPKTLHLAVSPRNHHTNLQLPTPVVSQHPSSEWTPSLKTESSADRSTANPQTMDSPVDRHSNVTRISTGKGSSIEATDINPIYEPPPSPAVKPIACFYIRIKIADVPAQDEYYRAVYLFQRNFSAFLTAVAEKANVNALDVVDTIYAPVNDHRGMRIQVDDDVITHIPEGKDMLVEFKAIDATPSTNERAMSLRTRDAHSRGPPRYTMILRY